MLIAFLASAPVTLAALTAAVVVVLSDLVAIAPSLLAIPPARLGSHRNRVGTGGQLCFVAYLKAGVPITVLSLLVGILRFTFWG